MITFWWCSGLPSGSRNFLKDSLSLRDRAIFSICVYNSTINGQIAWQKNTGYAHNSFYNISKFDLDPGKILDTMIQKRKNDGACPFLGTVR